MLTYFTVSSARTRTVVRCS